MISDLAAPAQWRFGLGIFGGILLPLVWLCRAEPSSAAPLLLNFVAVGQFIALLAGELLERYLFFTAVVASRMPGGIRT
jgi:formate dehydrogenase iron-sulfur subunit